MNLASLGWTSAWAKAFETLQSQSTQTLFPARVLRAHRGFLDLALDTHEVRADLAGRLRHQTEDPAELPGVGDWVAAALRPDGHSATVHHLLPRRTALVRQAPDGTSGVHLLAANVDAVFILTSANRDLNSRRLARYIALVAGGGAAPVVVISKCDLAEDLGAAVSEVERAAAGSPVCTISALTGDGLDRLAPWLEQGTTVAMVGSSGVGKSTLVNHLLGNEQMDTGSIRADDDRGRHTTSHRELVVLAGGAVLIDTPGLRSVGVVGDEGGVDIAFPDVEALLGTCRFGDCAHDGEPGCAIHAAIEAGALDPARFENYLKLKRESERAQVARHDRRRQMRKLSNQIRRRPKRWEM